MIFDRLFSTLLVLFFLQVPLFMHHYELQLIGHVEELKWQIEEMSKNAAQSHLSLEQYIKKFIKNEDRDFSNQGYIMGQVSHRFTQLFKALHSLQHSNVISKPFWFFSQINFSIFKSTLSSFVPGIPMSLEGLCYGLFGFVFHSLLMMIKPSKKSY